MSGVTPDQPTPFDYHEVRAAIIRMSRDLRAAAANLSEQEARFLVDAYYNMQEDRIRAGHQLRTLAQGSEPHDIMKWLTTQRSTLETQIAAALDVYSNAQTAGVWARSIVGIGPIISAGLLAHIDVSRSPTCGHVWRFAGLDPTRRWLGREEAGKLVGEVMLQMGEKGRCSDEAIAAIARRSNTRPELLRALLVDRKTAKIVTTREAVIKAVAKRPWNAGLKRLAFLIGESFVKVSNNDEDIYGKIYKARKELEIERNEALLFADQAKAALTQKRFGDDTTARKCYEKGMLPPARIHRRACRYATKLFLAHFHHVLHESKLGKPPPKPYIMSQPGHTHYLAPPNWPMSRD